MHARFSPDFELGLHQRVWAKCKMQTLMMVASILYLQRGGNKATAWPGSGLTPVQCFL